jgi:hypothetical protein
MTSLSCIPWKHKLRPKKKYKNSKQSFEYLFRKKIVIFSSYIIFTTVKFASLDFKQKTINKKKTELENK